MKVEYCPTEMIIADFYTKPVQGKMFRLFQNMILNPNDKYTQNNIRVDKLTLMEYYKSDDRDKNFRFSKECVEKAFEWE